MKEFFNIPISAEDSAKTSNTSHAFESFSLLRMHRFTTIQSSTYNKQFFTSLYIHTYDSLLQLTRASLLTRARLRKVVEEVVAEDAPMLDCVEEGESSNMGINFN